MFVTDFESRSRGYREREDAIRQWVSKADPESMDDYEIDAVSSATPAGGRLSYGWDFTDEAGARVPDGVYRLVLEGTLFWGSNVRYEAVLDMANLQPGPSRSRKSAASPTSRRTRGCWVRFRFIREPRQSHQRRRRAASVDKPPFLRSDGGYSLLSSLPLAIFCPTSVDSRRKIAGRRSSWMRWS